MQMKHELKLQYLIVMKIQYRKYQSRVVYQLKKLFVRGTKDTSKQLAHAFPTELALCLTITKRCIT